MNEASPAVDVFWGEIAPCSHSHMVQLYENDAVLIDSLEGFIGGGLEAGDAAIVIATPIHRMLLKDRLEARGIDLARVCRENRYIALDAEQTLKMFLVDGWPDAERFEEAVLSVLRRARGPQDRKVRAFGEMVAVLWAQGHHGAVVRLEHLWQSFCQRTRDMALFCAYPKAGITQDTRSAMEAIFAAHTTVLDGAVARH